MLAGLLKSIFGPKGPRPTDLERSIASELLIQIKQRVFCGPAEGELSLTGITETDAVPIFLWTHAKARDVVAEFLADKPEMTPQLREAIQTLHQSAARVAETLGPASAMNDVNDHADLAANMKLFLHQIEILGLVAQGKRWR